jgi:hypothetical protein
MHVFPVPKKKLHVFRLTLASKKAQRRNIKVLSVSSVVVVVVVDDHRLVAVIGFDRPAHLVLVIDRPRSRRWGFKGIKVLAFGIGIGISIIVSPSGERLE